MVVHYEYSYSYSYNYNAETTLERAKMPPSDNITSPLNLLSHAASAVVDETQRTVSLSSSTSSSSSPSPPPSPPPVCNKPATISPTLQPDPSSNFAKIPDATATLYSVTNLPPTTITTTARSPHPQTSKQQEQQQHQPQTQTQSQAPSILAVFQQFSPSASTSTLPMPPGMKITLAHSNSNSRSYSPTAAPIDETEIGGDRNSMYHREPKGAIGTARTATTATAARGKAATFKPARGKQSRYTMKYHYVSMPRWEAHRYIESLARDSANASMYRHHGHRHPDHYGTWIPPSAVRRVILNTTAHGSGYSDASSAGDGGSDSGRFPRSSVNAAREKFQLCVSNGTKIDPFTRSLALSKRYR